MSVFKPISAILFFCLFILAGCSETPDEGGAKRDAFSYANYDEVVVRHVDLDLSLDFEAHVLEGTADIFFEVLREGAGALVLDTRELEIKSITVNGAEVEYLLGATDALLGERLEIAIPDGAESVTITYRTSAQASGLQWLAPEQTAGKVYPFMFSQSQAIHARSWVPIQDTPAVRITYTAHLTTPPDLVAVMSAGQDPDGVKDGDYTFDMPQAIPAYLMAIAAGDLEFRAISDTIGVYAESYIVDAAAAEFADTPLMERANAALYGPYRWGRYDLLVLPPSFPFGGMENPRLSFLTPTLIAGDKSLTNVVAHELAHSWSGNLVTNSTWRDSWINEGITSYVENRVMENLYGEERAAMEQVMAKADWQRDMDDAEDPAMTALALPASLADPDDAFTDIPYVKGQFFMHFLEQRFGRAVFDAFLKSYFDHFAFQSITTEDFEAYLHENLIAPTPGLVTDAEITEWLYGFGMPDTTPNPVSGVLGRVDAGRAAWLSGDDVLEDLGSDNWITHEWLHFINGLPDDMALLNFQVLDQAFNLSGSKNAEIAKAWFEKSIRGHYQGIKPNLEAFLLGVGRNKFLRPLYTALAETEDDHAWAAEVYARARPGYHPISQAIVDEILAVSASN